jgi:hypothetical protein
LRQENRRGAKLTETRSEKKKRDVERRRSREIKEIRKEKELWKYINREKLLEGRKEKGKVKTEMKNK